MYFLVKGTVSQLLVSRNFILSIHKHFDQETGF